MTVTKAKGEISTVQTVGADAVFPQLSKTALPQGRLPWLSLGWVALRPSRPYPDEVTVKRTRVMKRASGHDPMLSYQADSGISELLWVGSVVRVDVGLEYFLSTSNGLQRERPQFLAKLQPRLKRKQIGSKIQLKVAGLHEQMANIRKDVHFKTAHQRFHVADVVIVEHLNLMGLNWGLLGKHILDASHRQFLNSVLPWVGCKCGKAVSNTLSSRWQECPCGCSRPRDVARALVLRHRF